MIYGIGVDTTTISRVCKSMERETFLPRVFGPQECELFFRTGMRAQTVAANFAAKEALGKALGTGLSGFVWPHAQVLRTEAGAPYFVFDTQLAAQLAQNGLRVHVSLTHEGDFATAFVVLEQAETPANGQTPQ